MGQPRFARVRPRLPRDFILTRYSACRRKSFSGIVGAAVIENALDTTGQPVVNCAHFSKEIDDDGRTGAHSFYRLVVGRQQLAGLPIVTCRP